MAKPITFDSVLNLMYNEFFGPDGENIKVNMKANGTTCTIYDGNSSKVPVYLLNMYGNYVVENITMPSEKVAEKNMAEGDDSTKTIYITLKQDDFDMPFSDVFYGHQPDDYLCVIARDMQDYSKEKQVFSGKMSELPVLLFNEIMDVPVFIDVPYSNERSNDSPEKYTIILKAHL